MAYIWLNQRHPQESTYQDEEGKVYHYRNNVPGWRRLSEGDQFVLYRPGEHLIYATGRVGEIEVAEPGTDLVDRTPKDEFSFEGSTGMLNLYAHLTDYRQFKPPINAREIKGEVSFLRDRRGLMGVPQSSIREISEADFRAIVSSAEAEVEA